MPLTSVAMAEYMIERHYRRKHAAVEMLGGKCVECGCDDEDVLQFDHIDPATKLFTIGKKIASVSMVALIEELLKCQLLCVECHKQKHRALRIASQVINAQLV